jgi:hypothetical protein
MPTALGSEFASGVNVLRLSCFPLFTEGSVSYAITLRSSTLATLSCQWVSDGVGLN